MKATWENEGVISADLKLDRTRIPEACDGDAPATAGDDEDDGAADSDAASSLGAPSSDT